MGKKIGAAVIGYGGMGGYHAERISERDDIELIGVYDIKPERNEAAREKGIFAFDTLEDLLKDERITFVTIATPNDVHKELAVQAMAAGKNVISEKPVAMNSGELEEMIEASRKYGKLFTVHQNRRWDSDYLTAKKIFDDNQLGRVFRIESRVHGSRGVPGDWRNRKAHGGGMVFDWGVHLLDQMLMMMEGRKVKSVYAVLTNISNDECDDGFTTVVKFEGDIEWIVEVSTNNFIELPRWYMLGENGSAEIKNWDLDGEIVKVTDWENKDAVPVVAGVGLTKTMAPRTDDSIDRYDLPEAKGAWTEYYDNIVEVLNGKAEQLITHAQLRRSMKLIETIFRSAAENQVMNEEF